MNSSNLKFTASTTLAESTKKMEDKVKSELKDGKSPAMKTERKAEIEAKQKITGCKSEDINFSTFNGDEYSFHESHEDARNFFKDQPLAEYARIQGQVIVNPVTHTVNLKDVDTVQAVLLDDTFMEQYSEMSLIVGECVLFEQKLYSHIKYYKLYPSNVPFYICLVNSQPVRLCFTPRIGVKHSEMPSSFILKTGCFPDRIKQIMKENAIEVYYGKGIERICLSYHLGKCTLQSTSPH